MMIEIFYSVVPKIVALATDDYWKVASVTEELNFSLYLILINSSSDINSHKWLVDTILYNTSPESYDHYNWNCVCSQVYKLGVPPKNVSFNKAFTCVLGKPLILLNIFSITTWEYISLKQN